MKLYLVDDNDRGIRYFQGYGKIPIYYFPQNDELSVLDHITSLRSIYSEKTLQQYAYYFLTLLGINGGIPWGALRYSEQKLVKILQTYLIGREDFVYIGFVDGMDIDDIEKLNQIIIYMRKLDIKEPIHVSTDFFLAGNIKADLYLLIETVEGIKEFPINGERGPKMGIRLLPMLMRDKIKVTKKDIERFLKKYPRKFKYLASLFHNFKDYLALVWLLNKGYAKYNEETKVISIHINGMTFYEEENEKIRKFIENDKENKMDGRGRSQSG